MNDTIFTKSCDMNAVPKWARDGLSVDHEGFERVRGEYISDVNCSITYYKHKSGLKVVAIVPDPDETESAFEIVFPTYPSCDGGHAHIIEHSVLGGSKCYPSKKSFSHILQGGFDTFFNAFTYRDRTSYLFATINEVFFKRAAHYILDGVFRPKLLTDDKILRQEGWHLVVRPEAVGETPAPDKVHEIVHHGKRFSFSGVVYNEERKRYSSITKQIYNTILGSLHTNAYKFDSGGEPNSIAGLSYDSLVSFYKRFYTPSRATIYIYTPQSLAEKLEFVHQFITQLTTLDAQADGTPLCTFTEEYRGENVEVELPYDPSGSVGDILVTAWLIDPIRSVTGDSCLNSVERVAWNVLEQALMGTDKSLIHKALIPHGTNLYPGFFDPTHQQAIFALGVEGFTPTGVFIKSTDKQGYIREFNSIVENALKEKVKDGFSVSELLAAINTVEFQCRELGSPHLPRGLQLSHVMHSQDIFGRDGIEALKFAGIFQYLRSQINKGYFEKLVTDKLLNNRHRVTIHAYPSQDYAVAVEKKYTDRLKTYVEKFTKEQVEQLQQEYQEFINETDDMTSALDKLDFAEKSHLPRDVQLSDVPKLPTEIPSKIMLLCDDKLQEFVQGNSGVPILIQQVPSNGILYMDLAYSLRNMQLSELRELKVLCSSWRESVSEEFEEQIGTHLGGLTVSLVLDTPFNNAHSLVSPKGKYSSKNNSCGYLILRTKFLAQNLGKALELVKKFFSVKVTRDKHKEVLSRLVNQMTLDFTNSGHFYSQTLLESCQSAVGYATEQISGFSFLKYLQRSTLNSTQSVAEDVFDVNELCKVLEKVLEPENAIISFTGSSAYDCVSQNIGEISSLNRLNGCTRAFDQTSLWATEITQEHNDEYSACAVPIPSTNNFVSVGGPLLNESDDIGTHLVISHWLSSSLLWDRVREKGGAYGVSATLTSCGNFYVTSYADPHILPTCDTVYNLAQLIRDEARQMNTSDVDKQKVGTLAKLDSVLTPSQKGFVALLRYVLGKTAGVNADIRNVVFNVTVDDFIKFAERLDQAKQGFGVAIVGNKGQILEQSEGLAKLFNRNKLKVLDL
ncbi:peptidase M16 inactive domain containin [Babesia microti strain RI]|uniref:Peptidase M16 inactive domain containin n=1 Tax=Babesia microti (strain RI) TaxID=1133968 RepID=I7JE10_BABMR|nr:peptidase M16 inactive domain containin [Babesia microti strain RI]CCF76120.1 peptidase M16 inactive domain containin [Babesia microti strain RI]|eukprot:XP_012650528.1 peptidase M16 inactive domain containin [Babesia microti strain RI]